MPITAADLADLLPALISDTTPASNGGRPSATTTIGGVKNSLLPDITAAERAAGVDRWRKWFRTLDHADDLALDQPRLSIGSGTPGAGAILLYPGTWSDTQATRTGRPYGYGTLVSNASAGATSLSVTTEADWSAWSAGDRPFQVGDEILIDARADSMEDAGAHERLTIATVSYSGSALTLTLTTELGSGYSTGAHVSSIYAPATLATSVSSVAASGGLDYDHDGHPITCPQVGAIYQAWTITLTSVATGALSITGDTLGSLGTGATGVDLSPVNPAGGTYFTVPAAGWDLSTAADGDALTFTTTPAGVPLWYRHTVPAGAAVQSSDSVRLIMTGESAE